MFMLPAAEAAILSFLSFQCTNLLKYFFLDLFMCIQSTAEYFSEGLCVCTTSLNLNKCISAYFITIPSL